MRGRFAVTMAALVAVLLLWDGAAAAAAATAAGCPSAQELVAQLNSSSIFAEALAALAEGVCDRCFDLAELPQAPCLLTTLRDRCRSHRSPPVCLHLDTPRPHTRLRSVRGAVRAGCASQAGGAGGVPRHLSPRVRR